MDFSVQLTPKELVDFLLHIAPKQTVFVWGPPGIGKTAVIRSFAEQVGMPLVSLLGSQLAPEDLIGVPQIKDGKSVFCPPSQIARSEKYCLLLDDYNRSSHEVQTAFYSLIHERRIGDYSMPEGSVVIASGNRQQDASMVKQVSAALLNRVIHVGMRASVQDWLEWAHANGLHPYVTEYITTRPDHLVSTPPAIETPFSTPRSWHMLSDGLKEYGDKLTDNVIQVLAYGTLTPAHAESFKGFIKKVRHQYSVEKLLDRTVSWPRDPKDRDLLYFMAQSLRSHLIKYLPDEKEGSASAKELAHKAKALIKDLSELNVEIAQVVVSKQDDGSGLPGWFIQEIIRDLPRLLAKDK